MATRYVTQERARENIEESKSTLASIVSLVKQIQGMPVEKDVTDDVQHALDALEKVRTAQALNFYMHANCTTVIWYSMVMMTSGLFIRRISSPHITPPCFAYSSKALQLASVLSSTLECLHYFTSLLNTMLQCTLPCLSCCAAAAGCWLERDSGMEEIQASNLTISSQLTLSKCCRSVLVLCNTYKLFGLKIEDAPLSHGGSINYDDYNSIRRYG